MFVTVRQTESHGYGWMDLGVGSFTFVFGLVSPEARQVTEGLRRTVTSVVPLVLLGAARLVSITWLGYHDPETEYGIHWNFFFSLAAVRLLSCPLLPLVRENKLVWVLAVLVAVLYEGVLTFWIGDWILSDAARDSLLAANREGVFSSLGFLAIYLAGVAWGRELFSMQSSLAEMVALARLLALWAGIMWLSLAYSTTFFLPPSRRLANYTFFTWIVAYNLSILTLFLATDLLLLCLGESVPAGAEVGGTGRGSRPGRARPRQPRDRPALRRPPRPSGQVEPAAAAKPAELPLPTVYRVPHLCQATDYNGLAFFLLANLGTGGVNLCLSTIHTPNLQALLIVLLYQAVLGVVTATLHKFKIKLKFW